MLEGVLDLRKGRLFVDELRSLEMGQERLEGVFGLVDYLLEQAQGKFFAND